MQRHSTHLSEVRIGQDVKTCEEVSRVNARHLASQLRILLLYIRRVDIGLAVKMVQIRNGSLTAFTSMTQRGDQKAIVLKRIHCRGRSIGNVLAMAILNIIRELTTSDALLLSLLSTIRTHKRLPVLRDAEDEIGTLERGDQRRDIVEIGGHDLDALCDELLGSGGRG